MSESGIIPTDVMEKVIADHAKNLPPTYDPERDADYSFVIMNHRGVPVLMCFSLAEASANVGRLAAESVIDGVQPIHGSAFSIAKVKDAQ